VVSVVTGGIGCMIATGWIAATTPALFAYRREDQQEDMPPADIEAVGIAVRESGEPD